MLYHPRQMTLPQSDQCSFRKKKLAAYSVRSDPRFGKKIRLLYGLECYALPECLEIVRLRLRMFLNETIQNCDCCSYVKFFLLPSYTAR